MGKMINETILSQGVLTIHCEHQEFFFDDLLDIAERCNPKRSFLFVSKVLGKHIPVEPFKMRASYRLLSDQMPNNMIGGAVVIGMAETAVGLAAGVFHEAKHKFDRAILLTSTRHEMDAKLLCHFKEDHSHATDHLIHLPQDAEMFEVVTKAKTLVLIDDEVTTGNTFKNLMQALLQSKYLRNVEKVFTLTLADWTQEKIQTRKVAVESLSLIKGRWLWEADTHAEAPVMPLVNTTKRGGFPIIGPQTWGRLGCFESVAIFGNKVESTFGQKTLVIGTGEFLWLPFLLAERLEDEGEKVLFGSTTRSPIIEGFAIQSALSFSDNYGQGIPNFIYNIKHQFFDRILLCIETSEESVDLGFLKALNKIANTVEVISFE